MSGEVVTWALYQAPMLVTDAGKPDSTSRFVLAVLADAAHRDGTESFPGVERIQFATGFNKRVIQRALDKLHKAGLIVEDGTRYGQKQWKLAIALRRPDSDKAELAAAQEERRRAETKYRQEYRAGVRRRPGKEVSGTENPGQQDVEGGPSGTESTGQGSSGDPPVRYAESRRPVPRIPSSGTENPGPPNKERTALGTVLRTVPGGRRAAPQTPAQLPLMAGIRSGLVSELEFVDPLTTRACEALPPDVAATVETERLAEYDRMHEPPARRPRTRKQRQRDQRGDPKVGRSA